MLHIYLLGSFNLTLADQPQRFTALPRTLPLFAYLLLNRHRPISRESLAFTMWPDVNEAEARSNLRRHLYELKRVLPPASDSAPWIVSDAGTVQWNQSAPYWFDIEEFEVAAESPEGWGAAAALYAGDLLPSLQDEWALIERERLRNLFFSVLDRLMERSRKQGELVQAISYGQRILLHDPMREDVVRALMALRLETGDRPGAMQEYQRFEQRLREELDVAPMVETNALYDQIARQTAPVHSPAPLPSPVLPPPIAPPAPLPSDVDRRIPSNLPAQLTSFIGREEELAGLTNLLLSSSHKIRLLTLTGPGGCGKSRLAIEAAARLHTNHPDRFPGGVFFAPLSTVTDHRFVLGAMAHILNVREVSGRPLQETLREYLRPRQMLVLLDNFEHVVAAAPLLVDLLQAAPGLSLIVTSRVRLRVYGEHEYPIAPLPAPEPEDKLSAAEIMRYAAVMLFVTRSRAVRPGFVLNDENAGPVAEICARLDGLPLAIELAAARSKLLTPTMLLERLGAGFGILSDGKRNATERHQTLQATLAWSYQLLEQSERNLFASLSVFAGPFTIEAAEAVCSHDVADILEGIEALLDHSLLQQVDVDTVAASNTPVVAAELRFRMLSTVRAYAAGHLEERADAAVVHRRHAAFYLTLAEAAEDHLRGPDQVIWTHKLDAEQFNLRGALRWTLDGDPEDIVIGMRIAAALGIYWYLFGYLTEAQRWLDEALGKGSHAPPLARARALFALGSIIHAQGDLNQAPPLFEEALQIYRSLDDRHGVADSLYALGRLFNRQQRFDAAERYLHESLALSEASGDDYRTAYSLNILAGIALNRGDVDQAHELYERALTRARNVGNKAGIAFILTAFGEFERLTNHFEAAERYYNEAMQLAQETGQRPRVVMLLHNLAHVALSRGDHQRAESLFRNCFRRGMELPDKENFAMCLLGFGAVAAQRGELERAARLFGAGEAMLDAIGARLAPADQAPYDHHRTSVQQQLSPDRFTALFDEGHRMNPVDAEHLALMGK